MRKNRKGITLISLVITIILLLILAGITISQLTGNGLFGKTETANQKTRYANAKEIVNLKLMEIQIDCADKNEEYNIVKIAEGMKLAEDITIEKYYNKETGSKKDGISENLTDLEGIVVSVNKYSEYKFLIGEECQIKGVLQKDVLSETTKMQDFIDIEEFESKSFGSTIVEDKEPLSVPLVDQWNLGVQNEDFKTYQGTPKYLGEEEGLYLDNSVIVTKGKYTLNPEYTIVVEVKDVSSSGFGYMVGMGYGGSGMGSLGLGIGVHNGDYGGISGAGDAYSINGGSVPINGQWHILSIKYDGSAFSLFIDGEKKGTSGASLLKNSELYIGGISNSGTSSAGIYWGYGNGYYRNLAIYDGALTDEELANYSF